METAGTMDLASLPYATKAIVALTLLVILYQLYFHLTTGAARRTLQRTKGTRPAPWIAGFSDHLFGWALFRANVQAIKDRCILRLAQERFHVTGANTFRMVVLGRHVHFTIEPENLKCIQATEHKKWSLGRRRIQGFTPLLGAGIFTTDGAAWAHSREMLRPNFVKSQVRDLEALEGHVRALVQGLPGEGREVDLGAWLFRLTMDSATEFLFGESTHSLTSPADSRFATAFGRSQDYIAELARYGVFAPLLISRQKREQFNQDRAFVHTFVDTYVRKGLSKRPHLLSQGEKPAPTTQRYVFIDELVRQSPDPIRIRSELLNILLAGRDTTASLLTNVWFVLSRRPDIWAALQAEIAPLNNQPPTFDQLKDLKYLKALLNESLRLHPVVPVNSREALEDTTLPLGGGPDGTSPIFIKKGEIVAWSLYAMHRRTDYYGPDAEAFQPERWLDDPVTGRKGLRPGWEFLPFNGGARICLGQQFALTEAAYVTVRLGQGFSRVEGRGDGVWREGLALTCVNLEGARVGLWRR
ncbi:putative P450 monooxygenase [Teratosphaeria nubilosa]|uniref:Putative P450 monooxygenase n=1 Tax=Teratosphaeria nubilosa TaxID=161662 RepID=A0A6G1L4T7_9PEZI|nr:putative P450 monooxygenase [Teratosphaeria nubilosa]